MGVGSSPPLLQRRCRAQKEQSMSFMMGNFKAAVLGNKMSMWERFRFARWQMTADTC